MKLNAVKVFKAVGAKLKPGTIKAYENIKNKAVFNEAGFSSNVELWTHNVSFPKGGGGWVMK